MNDKGFVSLALIIFMPLLLTLLFGTFWIIWFLNQKHSMDNICFEGVLKSQQKLVSANQKLLSLNFQARLLIIEKRTLDIIILVGPPPAKAAARIRRRFVVQQQKILGRTQKALLRLASYDSKVQLVSLRRKFYQKINSLQNFWKSKNPKKSFIIITPKSSQVQIQFKDIASIYKRTADHSSLQEIKASWQVPLESLVPKSFKKIIPIHKKWRGRCESHPHKGGLKWYPSIGVARH